MSITRVMDLHWNAHVGMPQFRFLRTEQHTNSPNHLVDVYMCCMCDTTVDVVRPKGEIIKGNKDEQENSGD